jgi:tRNA1Val (adenine37-N6)-methyltransferase
MKIGTDGVLLGAWSSIDHQPKNILDIGAGTGIIAMQIAQRTTQDQINQPNAIDAIEMNSNAYEQCVENFEGSPWNDLLLCYHASLEEFVDEIDETYDLIVSNPPFHSDSLESSNNDRSQARSNHTLPFKELLRSVSKLLSNNGVFSVIIPFNEEESFIDLASQHSLFPKRICRVKGNEQSKIKRSLIEFSTYAQDVKMEQLIIEHSRHDYTQDYIELVRDFYLNM